MKVLFWVPYPTAGPSNRFRVEQYLPYLKERGIAYSLHSFWEDAVYRILYENGYYLKKIYYFIKGSIKRFKDLVFLSRYDLVFIHREAYPIGGAFLERMVFKKKPIIYDFDDSVFLPTSYNSSNRIMRLLKRPAKTAQIIKMSTMVIAGNSYLKEYAIQYNKNVIVIPTPVDTNKYFPLDKPQYNNKIIVGWIGTYTTNQYLNILKNALLKLINKFGRRIEIRFIGCRDNYLNIAGIIYNSWSLTREVNDIQNFDIGIMPVWDDAWTRGKCAFKILQYMAVGASVVASPVGMNKEIIKDGEYGFLAANEEKWIEKLSLLIDNPELRHRFSLKGRTLIEKEYSLKVTAPKFINVLEKANAYAKK